MLYACSLKVFNKGTCNTHLSHTKDPSEQTQSTASFETAADSQLDKRNVPSSGNTNRNTSMQSTLTAEGDSFCQQHEQPCLS